LEYNCGTVDGIFGAKTDSATKKFQKDYGLAVDGVVGAQTWGALIGG
jgi:peptidoglycan hydrolase-like protein with peptidoglycan-binding domain